MRLELPVCKRCCLCLPLRYGLIVWGYIRLVIATLVTVGTASLLHRLLGLDDEEKESTTRYTASVVILLFVVILAMVDIGLSVLFIIGGHRKNLKLLRTYYVYSLAVWVLMGLMGFALTVYFLSIGVIKMFNVWYFLIDLTTFLAHMTIQAYVLLLVRSEILKLKNNCDFKFVNNAAEAACTIELEGDLTGKEKKKTEDILYIDNHY